MRQGTSGQAGSVRFAVVVTLVVLLVWGAIGVIVWYVVRSGLGWFGGAYARIEVGPDKVVWVEVRGSQMRVAETKERLASAKWEGTTWEGEVGEEGQTPMVALPLGGNRPSDWEAVEVQLQSQFGSQQARWRLSRTDGAGETWRYLVEREERLGSSADESPLIKVPSLAKISLAVEGQARMQEGKPAVGVGLKLTSGGYQVTRVQQPERGAEAQVRVLNDKGKVVAEQSGSLDDFGYT